MSWLQVHIDLGNIRPEPVEEALVQLGATSIEYRDGGGEPIWEPAPGTAPLWVKTRVAALFDRDASQTKVLLAVAGSVAPAPMPEVRFSFVEDEDWISRWKRGLEPTRHGSKLWICPPGMPCPDTRGIRVTLAPGLAFGTGSHPTTALCLDWLAEQTCDDQSVLDFGCGSGILAIAALALGARTATAVDIDEQALTATRENASQNLGSERLQICPANRLALREPFDIVVANILSNTLIELAPVMRRHCESGTRIALSGILTDQVPDVCCAYASWVEFEPPVEREDWAILFGVAA
jgi:ribosomal protein L11 methyltransferase